jgi:hypothetical protein
MPEAREGPERIVWARGDVGVTTCPTSYITAESLTLLEEFHVSKLFGAGIVSEMPARRVEAFFTLENELAGERDREED